MVGQPSEEHPLNRHSPIHPRDVPDSVLCAIRDDLKEFFIPMVGRQVTVSPPTVNVLGSGTLVKVAREFFILTAAHVWEAAQAYPSIGLFRVDSPSIVPVRRDFIVPQTLGRAPFGEWGPDLALLKIPHPDSGTLLARQSALDLVAERGRTPAHPPSSDAGLWVTLGVVAERSDIAFDPAEREMSISIDGPAGFSPRAVLRQNGAFDYRDVSFDPRVSFNPHSHGGTSGAGLWLVPLSRDANGAVVWRGARIFQGVAFWEQRESPEDGFIRCHGADSLFKVAWEAWGFPNKQMHPTAAAPPEDQDV